MIRAVGRQTGWAWVLQRISAILLIVGLGIHFWALHYIKLVAPERTIPSASNWVGVRFAESPVFWMLFDSCLLGLALYHGLNGIYNIVSDYKLSGGAKKTWSWGLWIIGLAAFAMGVSLLPRFLGFAVGGGI